MGVEIERKFLVADVAAALAGATSATPILQGYLSRDPDRTVRVRFSGDRTWLTVKGRAEGPSRPEHEEEVSRAFGEGAMSLVDGEPLSKVRHRVPHAGRVWEVDVFGGAHEGLVTAEVELGSADEEVALPGWVGREVTGDPRYANSNLDGAGSAAAGPDGRAEPVAGSQTC